jgi:hypothetical protein
VRRTLLALAAVACLAAGCEPPQQVAYKDGRYAGKPDTPAWDNPPFNGDRAAWERAIKARNLHQNEYSRTSGRGL